MKQYIHDPQRFRDHFGGGLPAFQGARMQRGGGIWTSRLKRFAVPLLMAGVKAAAPHLKNVANAAMKQVFPNNPIMQRVAGSIAGNISDHVIGRVTKTRPRKVKKKRKLSQPLKRQTKTARTTTRNIFE